MSALNYNSSVVPNSRGISSFILQKRLLGRLACDPSVPKSQYSTCN
jgi:hypothetical protein